MRIGVAAIGRISEETGGRNYIEHFFRSVEKLRVPHEFVLFLTRGEAGKLSLPSSTNIVELPRLGGTPLAKVLTEQIVLSASLRRSKIDVMYYPGNFAPLISSTPYVLSIRAVAHFYGAEYNVSLPRRIIRGLLMPPSARQAAAIITPSADIKKDIVRFTHANPKKIHVIPHGIDTEIFDGEKNRSSAEGFEILERFSLAPGKYLLYVSALWQYKNHDKLIQAFAALRDKLPGISLVLAGKGTGVNDAYESGLRKLPTELGIEDRVKFTGNLPQSELRYLYAHACAMIFPSSYESFGNPILESWASGIPIAVSNIHSFPEIVGNAGVFFDPKNSAALQHAILEILLNEPLRASLMQKGTERLQLFSWESTVKRTLSLLESVSTS